MKIKGIVTDEKNEPLSFANVIISDKDGNPINNEKGFPIGVSAKEDGSFELDNDYIDRLAKEKGDDIYITASFVGGKTTKKLSDFKNGDKIVVNRTVKIDEFVVSEERTKKKKDKTFYIAIGSSIFLFIILLITFLFRMSGKIKDNK